MPRLLQPNGKACHWPNWITPSTRRRTGLTATVPTATRLWLPSWNVFSAMTASLGYLHPWVSHPPALKRWRRTNCSKRPAPPLTRLRSAKRRSLCKAPMICLLLRARCPLCLPGALKCCSALRVLNRSTCLISPWAISIPCASTTRANRSISASNRPGYLQITWRGRQLKSSKASII
ncbi:hypothetical protein D9M68_813710 [compost metagenome]